jgi:5'-3' exonuclease
MSAPHASPNPSPHLLVIDAQSLAARAAHVAGDDAVAGVRLWCQMARGTALDVQASHVVAAWDHDGPTFRHALFPSYKHRRTGSTRAKVAPIRAALETAGLVSLSVEGFEGDDVVASVMAMYHADLPVTLGWVRAPTGYACGSGRPRTCTRASA